MSRLNYLVFCVWPLGGCDTNSDLASYHTQLKSLLQQITFFPKTECCPIIELTLFVMARKIHWFAHQAAGQVKIRMISNGFFFPLIYADIFCDAGQVPF